MMVRHDCKEMPELPEVETLRRQLLPWLVGRRIERAWIRPPDGRRAVVRPDPDRVRRVAEGATLLGIDRHGKRLDLKLDNGCHLLVHLGMTGRLELRAVSVAASADRLPPHSWIALALGPHRLTDRALLVYRDPRRLGSIEAAEHPFDRRQIGIDPFDPDFDPAIIAAQIARRRAPIKSVLLNQHLIAGLGSIYADELCFLAGVNPRTPAAQVPRESLARMLSEVRPLLQRAIAGHGATLDRSPYQDIFGTARTFLPRAYGRAGEPCVSCGAGMVRERLGNGSRGRTYTYCPVCQPSPTPAAPLR